MGQSVHISIMDNYQQEQEINNEDFVLEECYVCLWKKSTKESEGNNVKGITQHDEQETSTLTGTPSANTEGQTTGGNFGRNVIERVEVQISVPCLIATAFTLFRERCKTEVCLSK